jgi:hypothetical protein
LNFANGSRDTSILTTPESHTMLLNEERVKTSSTSWVVTRLPHQGRQRLDKVVLGKSTQVNRHQLKVESLEEQAQENSSLI